MMVNNSINYINKTNSIHLLTGSEDNSCFVWPEDWTVGRSLGLRATVLVYNYFIWSMIQRGSDTSFTNLWSLLLYIQSLLHYIENAQENKKNTILSYNIAENSKRVKRNEEKVCVCVCMDAGWCLVSTLND